ncbi:hypothetical protein STENM223S_01025 [Streptomyces tendae]
MSTAQQVPDILSPEFAADPYPAYRVMRESAPLIWHEATKSYIVSRYEDVERVFKDKAGEFTTDNYAWQIEPVHGKTILQLSGREHAVRRALVAPAFRGKELEQKFLPVIERNSRELIDAFRHKGAADLVDDYATRFPVNVIADMLGLDKADHPRFHRWYTAVIAFLGNLSGDPEVTAAGADPGGVRRVHAADHPRAPGEPGRRPAVRAVQRRGRRRTDERRGRQGVLQPAAGRRRRDHRQGHRRYLREPARPPRPARRRPRRPLADTARLRGDPAVHPAGPHDHAAVRDGGHRQRRHHRPAPPSPA